MSNLERLAHQFESEGESSLAEAIRRMDRTMQSFADSHVGVVVAATSDAARARALRQRANAMDWVEVYSRIRMMMPADVRLRTLERPGRAFLVMEARRGEDYGVAYVSRLDMAMGRRAVVAQAGRDLLLDLRLSERRRSRRHA